MNEDKIQIWGKWLGHEIDHPDCLLLETEIHLNGKKVDWNFVDIYSLALYYRNCKPYKDYHYSYFEPFSCSYTVSYYEYNYLACGTCRFALLDVYWCYLG